MSDLDLPHILFVDDEDGTEFARQLMSAGDVRAKWLHPRDVEEEDLRTARLILVDLKINKDWPELEEQELSTKPVDGLALASIYRRNLSKVEGDSATAIALLSGELDVLRSPLSFPSDDHILARFHNLEWVFEKRDKDAAKNITALCLATENLQDHFPNDTAQDSLVALANFLGITEEHEWFEQLRDDIEDCLPPIHSYFEASQGLSVIRWLAQRILPYPCFLIDTYYLAARLQVPYSWLEGKLEGKDAVIEAFSLAEYTGELNNLMGPRWWSSAIEMILWEETGNSSLDISKVHEWLQKYDSQPVETLKSSDEGYFLKNPVVCMSLKEGLLRQKPTYELESMKKAVRVQPDDWPPYALSIWMRINDITSNPGYRSLVSRDDRSKLEEETD